jgi:hypothetical protein
MMVTNTPLAVALVLLAASFCDAANMTYGPTVIGNLTYVVWGAVRVASSSVTARVVSCSAVVRGG